jgi:hypothetical protein
MLAASFRRNRLDASSFDGFASMNEGVEGSMIGFGQGDRKRRQHGTPSGFSSMDPSCQTHFGLTTRQRSVLL